jgi:hypothetical protein
MQGDDRRASEKNADVVKMASSARLEAVAGETFGQRLERLRPLCHFSTPMVATSLSALQMIARLLY